MRGHGSHAAVNWELLRTDSLRLLRSQPGWLAAGLTGPLSITLYTLLRPWSPLRAERDLLQAALFFAAWNVLFALAYAVSAWLRPRHDSAERELLHLPLSCTHFALRRLLQAGALPLAAALLALPLWGMLLLYSGTPYGVDADQTRWTWLSWQETGNPWLLRMAWVAGSILSAALLPAALVLWLDELIPNRWLRCILLLVLPAALYLLIRMLTGEWDPNYGGYWVKHGPLLMNYRQTRGVGPLPYLALLGCVLLGPLLIGWLRPAWRRLLLSLPVLLIAAFFLRAALPETLQHPLRPASSVLFNRDTRYAAALFTGHLSPPQNIRLLWHSYPSNVLFTGAEPLIEPDYPNLIEPPYPRAEDYADTDEYHAAQKSHESLLTQARLARDEAYAEYQVHLREYEAAYAAAPRLPLWVCAGLYPLLLPLWAAGGLLCGIRLRGEAPRY